MPTFLEKVNSAIYILAIANKAMSLPFMSPIESKIEGLGLALGGLFAGDISAKDALETATALHRISLPYSLVELGHDEDPDREFRGIIHLLEKKIEAEETGKASLFMCTGCGLHAFFVGRDFMSVNSLNSKLAVDLALTTAAENNLITLDEVIEFTKQRSFFNLKGLPDREDLEIMSAPDYEMLAFISSGKFL